MHIYINTYIWIYRYRYRYRYLYVYMWRAYLCNQCGCRKWAKQRTNKPIRWANSCMISFRVCIVWSLSCVSRVKYGFTLVSNSDNPVKIPDSVYVDGREGQTVSLERKPLCHLWTSRRGHKFYLHPLRTPRNQCNVYLEVICVTTLSLVSF
jgi:hypothetical protein